MSQMDREPRFGTVVLNYKNYADTLECVNSLLHICYKNHFIIIVDNGSNNESLKILHEHFGEVREVIIIANDENLGFAKGNNIGIDYARQKLQCDYVFVLNSDTLVKDGIFEEILRVDISDVGVISPCVIDVNGNISQPSENSDDIYKRIRQSKNALILASLINAPGVRELYKFYKKRTRSVGDTSVNNKVVPRKYVLQGCSYFLTPSFFRYYSHLFPETFLYWEEIDLLLYLEKANLRSVMVDTPPVLHKEGRSTDMLIQDREKMRKKLEYSYYSYKRSKQLFKMSCKEIQENYNLK